MASITAAVDRVKDELPQRISEASVSQACESAGHRWRERMLTPVVVIRLFVLQVLWGNVSCRTVTHLSELVFTAQAYCKARAKLPVEVLSHIAAMLTHEARQKTRDFGRWKGHRVMHIDGTGLSMPDEKVLQETYGQPAGPKRGCGYPVMHVLWLFDAPTGLIVDFIADRCHTHDMAHAAKLHKLMEEDDVMVGDCAFASFAHLALLLQDKLHGVFRVHHRRIVDFTRGRQSRRQRPKAQRRGAPTSRWIRPLGDQDQVVEYAKPKQRPVWISQDDYDRLPASIVVRELRYTIERPGFRTRVVTLVTTLLDERKYAKQELAELYGARWQIETNLKHLKHTMNMDVLRSKTVQGVQKELWVYLIGYNQVRLLMLDAAERQCVSPDRISFIDALDAVRHRNLILAVALTLVVNPLRPARHEPRVIKRRKDRYTYMTKPREELRKTLGITKIVA